jgi:SAM-dependent methyltransferase
VDRAEIVKRRDAVVATSGPWEEHDLCLADGVFTIGSGVPDAERRVRLVVQVLKDAFDGRFAARRVLDLGCGEGGFALEIARQGADVVGLEDRTTHLERARFAAEAMGLTRTTFVAQSADRLSPEEHGFFDAVLVLSIFDRLDGEAAAEAIMRAGAVCKGTAIVEARIAPKARTTLSRHGAPYHGVGRGGRGGRGGFAFTRPSMLNLMTDAGFTTIAQLEQPEGERGVVTWVAMKGRRASLLTAPQANAVPARRWSDAPAASPLAGLIPRRGR